MTVVNHTFVVLAYKDSKYLEDCIRSLVKQTVRSNIFIATSTPSNFIASIALRYKIDVRINDNGQGIASDWNFAYKECITKYLTLAHQDDVYLPEYTEQCIARAEKKSNTNSLIVFTDYKEIKNDKEVGFSIIIMVKKLLLLPFLVKNNISIRFIKKSILSLGNSISCPTVMFNVDNIGPFDFSDKYQYNLDWEAWLRLANKDGKFIYVNQKLMLHRIHNESQTILQIQDNNRLKEEEMIFTMIWNKGIAKLLMSMYRYGSQLNANKSN